MANSVSVRVLLETIQKVGTALSDREVDAMGRILVDALERI